MTKYRARYGPHNPSVTYIDHDLTEHLHFGSDSPFTPEFVALAARERLAGAGDPPGSLFEALRANTERLFPTLGGGAVGLGLS